jgi:hypothetical protein
VVGRFERMWIVVYRHGYSYNDSCILRLSASYSLAALIYVARVLPHHVLGIDTTPPSVFSVQRFSRHVSQLLIEFRALALNVELVFRSHS